MSNRAGKRERLARNRHVRGTLGTRIGSEWVTLKVGRGHLGRQLRRSLSAVPVGDSRKTTKTDE
jgi:hypothetical protein